MNYFAITVFDQWRCCISEENFMLMRAGLPVARNVKEYEQFVIAISMYLAEMGPNAHSCILISDTETNTNLVIENKHLPGFLAFIKETSQHIRKMAQPLTVREPVAATAEVLQTYNESPWKIYLN